MAEASVDMSNNDSSSPPADDPEDRTARLEREAEEIRQHLDGLLGELDRRRDAAVDMSRQIGRYLVPAAITFAAVAATVWGVNAMLRRRRSRRRRLMRQASSFATQVSELLASQRSRW